MYSLYNNTSGNSNFAFGRLTLQSNGVGNCNIALGYCTAPALNGGCNNVLLGATAAPLGAACSNMITLGNSTITQIRAQVTSITALSDYRDKSDIYSLDVGLDFLRQVRPVKFTWNMRDGGKIGVKETGFIAQELENVLNNSSIKDWLDGFIITNEDRSRIEATPQMMFPMVIKAIQELDSINANLISRIVVLENALNINSNTGNTFFNTA